MIAAALLHPGGAVALTTFTKTASPSSGAAGLTVIYTYTFDNTTGSLPWNVTKPYDHTLTFPNCDQPCYDGRGVVQTDPCSPVVFSGGDSNGNNIVDIGEVWTWTCSAVVNATTYNYAELGYWNWSGGDYQYGGIVDNDAVVSITAGRLSVSIRASHRPVCKNDLVHLTAEVIGGIPPYTFAWTTGETSKTITPSTSVAGSFPFGVTVTENSGTTASANTTLSIAAFCLTDGGIKTVRPEFPILTTIKWGCDWKFAGVCLHRTIDKICIGGHCFDNPAVPGPPVCKVCGLLIGVGAGFALALAAGLLWKKIRGRNIGSGTRFEDGRPQ
jgi:hypothetical protein